LKTSFLQLFLVSFESKYNLVLFINLNSNEKKIKRDELEHILFVFAKKHESEDCAVDGKPEESLPSSATCKSMVSSFDRLSESHRQMRALLKIVSNNIN
jgi:hypothetical protein